MSSSVSSRATAAQLTRHPQGSLRELWAISFPLMLSLMSSSVMYFWDRLLLAHFSIDAHNAAATAGTMALALQFAFVCTAAIAEVFVGQANGSGEQKKLAVPVWQMIWLSLFSLVFFLPAGLFAGQFIFGNSSQGILENSYFTYLMYFGPFFCLNGALSAFYVGRGRVFFATLSIVISNVVNTILAYVLIFGWEPYLPSMGISGAAIAMGVSQAIQALMLAIDFLRSKNRKRYGTGNYYFVLEEFMKCIRVGVPGALAHTIEIFAWALFFQMLATVSDEHLTVVSIGQSIFFLFTFITEGISKGAMALAANFIGAGQWHKVRKLLLSGVKFYVIVFLALGGILAIYPGPLIELFIADATTEMTPEIYKAIAGACLWVWFFFLFDGIHWLVVGLLTAAGDTGFILKAGSSAIWLLALLPTYLFVVLLGCHGDTAWAITAFYGAGICAIYLGRFYSEKWQESHGDMSLSSLATA